MRILLAWLLACAVPAQGFAAASMFHCGTGPLGQAAQSDGLAAHQHGHNGGDTPAAHHHDDELSASAVAYDAAGADNADADDTSQVFKRSCSACATCSTAAALPTKVVTFDATQLHEFIVPLAPLSVAAFLTDGPERPPRSLLA